MIFARAFVALLLALLAGAWLSRRFTRPLSELSHGAQVLQSGNFDYRLPVHGGDEFTQVSQALNGLAERVEQQINHLEEEARRRQQFLADAAHELRSPVTTMRTMAGALQEGLAEDPERRARAIHALVRTSDRLQHLVTDLLDSPNSISMSCRCIANRSIYASWPAPVCRRMRRARYRPASCCSPWRRAAR